MIYYVLIILIVMALSEIIKRAAILDAKIIPFINIIIGVCIHAAYSGFGIFRSITSGIYIGILATGIYSTVKNIIEWIKLRNKYK